MTYTKYKYVWHLSNSNTLDRCLTNFRFCLKAATKTTMDGMIRVQNLHLKMLKNLHQVY